MSYQFKVGDKVRQKGECRSTQTNGIYIVTIDQDASDLSERGQLGIGDKKDFLCHCKSTWELIGYSTNLSTTIANTMQNLTSMLKRLLDKPAQSLYKAGFINGDLKLTDLGQSELMTILFDTHKDALVKAAEEKIAEEEAKK